ncbi:GNAT family N-acetyltransferase [Streptomyces sp. NPDC057939]|uniref:GNAT family N-acetyltransferase n=1 Tax=Streptomyces sp. NPDC057939 TaxID=3346284 RepID=UPI0036EB248E
MTLTLTHTAGLGPGERREIRALLDAAFDGDFADEDFEHALGGMHVLLREGDPDDPHDTHDPNGPNGPNGPAGSAGALVAHGSVVQRRVLHGGRALRTGYVEAVAVRSDRRRRGLAGQVMAELERVIGGAYVLGALSASEAGAALYEGRGWRPYPGRIGVLGPTGPERLADEEGSTYVWTPAGAAPPDPTGRLDFDWRDGDVL